MDVDIPVPITSLILNVVKYLSAQLVSEFHPQIAPDASQDK